MESLAIAIRTHPLIHGIKTGDLKYNTAMYPDDNIVFLSHIAESIPYHFGSTSGFKVNKEKKI